MRRSGFTLLELLIGMAVFSIILAAGIGAFVQARGLFFKLKAAEEDIQAVDSALDRMRIDLVRAGRGLKDVMDRALVSAVEAMAGRLTILSAGAESSLVRDLASGSGRADIDSADGFKKGGMACFLEGCRGEIRNVSAVEGNSLVLDVPVGADYGAGACRVIGIESVRYFLGSVDRIVRRQVNASPAQPLIEEVDTFLFSYDAASNAATASLRLRSGKERTHGILVFPKNAGLSRSR